MTRYTGNEPIELFVVMAKTVRCSVEKGEPASGGGAGKLPTARRPGPSLDELDSTSGKIAVSVAGRSVSAGFHSSSPGSAYEAHSAIPALTQALSHPNNAARAQAVAALELIAGEDAIPSLRETINDSDPVVRSFARTALDRLERKARQK